MDSESLTFLLAGGHYNVPDRIARGIWPHPPLNFEMLVDHLTQIIVERDWFPYQPKLHLAGEAVDEFGVIERVNSGHFVYHASRHDAILPTILVGKSETTSLSAEAAARHYLKWTLNLPGDLDSWKVI